MAETWPLADNPGQVLGSGEESLRLGAKTWSLFQLILIISRKTFLQDTRIRMGTLGFSHLRKQIFQSMERGMGSSPHPLASREARRGVLAGLSVTMPLIVTLYLLLQCGAHGRPHAPPLSCCGCSPLLLTLHSHDSPQTCRFPLPTASLLSPPPRSSISTSRTAWVLERTNAQMAD